jgi:sulfur transfer complex TusBCD TusB component (DsrH family)
MSTEPVTKEESTEFIKNIARFIEETNRKSMAMIKEGILKELEKTQLYEDPTHTLCFLQDDIDTAIEKGYNNQVANLHAMTESITKSNSKDEEDSIKNIPVFIENTNRESMMMIKNGILNAIEELKNNNKLYKDPTGKFYFLQVDIDTAIEKGYTIQVATYEELRKDTIAGITESNPKESKAKIAEIDTIMKNAKAATPLPSNAPLNIVELHKITEDIWARARATPLPVSNSNTNNNSGYSTNNNSGKNTPNNSVKLSNKKLLNKKFRNPYVNNKSRKRTPRVTTRTPLPRLPASSNNEQ